MNDIIKKLIDKQVHLLPDEQMDAEIFRTIQEIDSKYLLLNKTKKEVDLTKSLNEMFGTEYNYRMGKMPIGLTFQELLLKAIAFHHDDPFGFIKEKCIVIPKNDEVLDYLNSVDVTYELLNETAPDLASNKVRLYEHKFKERNDKQFNSKFSKISNSNNIIIKSNNDHSFHNGHLLLDFKLTVPATEEDREAEYLAHNDVNSPKQQEVNKLLENFTEKLFDRKFDINIVANPLISKNNLEFFNGSNIFRTKNLIFDKGRMTSKKITSSKIVLGAESHLYCYVGLFLTYDQYCDLIIKGSLN